jgi:hypothetical protein
VDDLAERFARAERQGLIQLIRARPELPMSDLLSLVEGGRTGRLLGSLTLAECRAGRADDEAVENSQDLDKAKVRASYDGRVLDVLRGTVEPLSPTQISERVGGTAHEARVALQRLAASKKITRVWMSGGHGYQVV